MATPLSQGDSRQLDQVPHARSDDDGLLIRVAGLVVALHLLHHELGVAQQSVLGEAVEVETSGGHRGLRAHSGWTDMSDMPTQRESECTLTLQPRVTSILLRRSS